VVTAAAAGLTVRELRATTAFIGLRVPGGNAPLLGAGVLLLAVSVLDRSLRKAPAS
jgi:hypothetical protein